MEQEPQLDANGELLGEPGLEVEKDRRAPPRQDSQKTENVPEELELAGCGQPAPGAEEKEE